MFVVENKLISDDVAEAAFACNLAACHGACCVQGDSGAPLEAEERATLERALPAVYHDLRPEAQTVLDERGVWEPTDHDAYAVPCTDDGACVFVVYDGPVAKCALQNAYYAGRSDFEKPISCHLYPIRIETYGTYTVLNYEQIDLCAPARVMGRNHGIRLEDYLERPLTRKYGAAWYAQFKAACADRREALVERYGPPQTG